jgi:hypothetical protein
MAEIKDLLDSALSLHELNAAALGRGRDGAHVINDRDDGAKNAEDTVSLTVAARALANGEDPAGVEETGAREAEDLTVVGTFETEAYGRNSYSNKTESLDEGSGESAETPGKAVDTYA